LLGTLEDRYKRLLRQASVSIEALLGNLEGCSSDRNFEREMSGALGMEYVSLKRLSMVGL
jgi:hypothetical protein